MTNGDKLRSMSNVDIADVLLGNVCNVCGGKSFGDCDTYKYCKQNVLDWLYKGYVEKDFKKLFCGLEDKYKNESGG